MVKRGEVTEKERESNETKWGLDFIRGALINLSVFFLFYSALLLPS